MADNNDEIQGVQHVRADGQVQFIVPIVKPQLEPIPVTAGATTANITAGGPLGVSKSEKNASSLEHH